jgi:hypothetical protein
MSETDVGGGHSDRVWAGKEDQRHECGPWIECAGSSRVSRFRYDYQSGNLQVLWMRPGRSPGTVYEDVDFETFRRFARVTSRGKFVNSTLNGFAYRDIEPHEQNAPSSNIRAVPSRTR